jgi:hypothetical protein
MGRLVAFDRQWRTEGHGDVVTPLVATLAEMWPVERYQSSIHAFVWHWNGEWQAPEDLRQINPTWILITVDPSIPPYSDASDYRFVDAVYRNILDAHIVVVQKEGDSSIGSEETDYLSQRGVRAICSWARLQSSQEARNGFRRYFEDSAPSE